MVKNAKSPLFSRVFEPIFYFHIHEVTGSSPVVPTTTTHRKAILCVFCCTLKGHNTLLTVSAKPLRVYEPVTVTADARQHVQAHILAITAPCAYESCCPHHYNAQESDLVRFLLHTQRHVRLCTLSFSLIAKKHTTSSFLCIVDFFTIYFN